MCLHLAAASLDQVRLKWQGLGYYSRARRLHNAAQMLVGGPWPRTLEEWMALPGIGRTTAGSILSSAFNAPLPILDGNVKRVLARLAAHPRPPARDEVLFWGWSTLVGVLGGLYGVSCHIISLPNLYDSQTTLGRGLGQRDS